jgi:3-phenylpropionate/trans-cinnamate dioxygenase ferredoxin subunit
MKQELCKVADLVDAVPKLVKVDNRAIAVIQIESDIYAIDARCPHWDAIMASGTISKSRREITCPMHGFRYSLVDGACVASPSRPSITTFAVTLDDGKIIADIGP